MTLDEIAKKYGLDDEVQTPVNKLDEIAKKYGLDEEKPTQDLLATEPSSFELEMGLATPEPPPVAPTPAAPKEEPLPSLADVEYGGFETEMGEEPKAEVEPFEFKVPMESVAQDDVLFNIIRNYGVAKYGKEDGDIRPDEDKLDYIRRFQREMRAIRSAPSTDGLPELLRIKNASEKEAVDIVTAHKLFEAMAELPAWEPTKSLVSKEGLQRVVPTLESIYYTLKDPTTYAGGIAARVGIGVAGRKMTSGALTKELQNKLTKYGVVSGVGGEFLVNTYAATKQQELQNAIDGIFSEEGKPLETKVLPQIPEGASVSDAALAVLVSPVGQGLISSVFGYAEGKGLSKAVRQSDVKSRKELSDALKLGRAASKDLATKDFTKAFDAALDKTLDEFDYFEGVKVLDKIAPESLPAWAAKQLTGTESDELTQSIIKKEISKRAVDVAKYVMLLDPNFRPAKGQKVSVAVKNVFMSFESEQIDDSVINAALKKAQITPQEFAQATRATVGEAATIMQSYSALARTLNRIGRIDAKAAKIIDQIYGRESEVVSVGGALAQGVRRGEAESKALVTAAIATSARNAMGTGTSIGLQGASRLLEGTLYTYGKALQTGIKGEYKVGDITKGLNDAVKDAFGTIAYLADKGLTRELTGKLLTGAPELEEVLLSALQETGTKKLSRVSEIASTLNVAQDAMFRKAVFTASVERQLRQVGMNMFELLAEDKAIPSSILKNAVDDALKTTFSYMPKPTKGGVVTLEAIGETAANKLVSFVENLPGGSIAFTPFPRFIANAMAFQYKYTASGIGGIQDALIAARGSKAIWNPDKKGLFKIEFKKLDDPEVQKYARQALGKFTDNGIGLGLIYALYHYRLENQDTEPHIYKNADGTLVDTRAIYPYGNALTVADIFAKAKLGNTADIDVATSYEVLTGQKLASGQQSTLFKNIPLLFSESEKEKDALVVAAGKVLGDVATRFTQPGQPIYALFDMIDEDADLARDPNVITGEMFGDSDIALMGEAAVNRIKSRTPIEQVFGLEELPPYKPYLREETPRRVGEFFAALSGIKLLPKQNIVEDEFVNLGLDPYTYFGASGDKQFDRLVIEKAGPQIQRMLPKLIQSPRYQKLDENLKRIAIRNTMAGEEGIMYLAKELAKAEYFSDEKSRKKFEKTTFNRLPQVERRAINTMYKQKHGVTLEEADAYDETDVYKALLERYR